jgi:hypothetical protein
MPIGGHSCYFLFIAQGRSPEIQVFFPFTPLTAMQTKTKRRTKPLVLAEPPEIPTRDPTPLKRPLNEIDALVVNFDFLLTCVSEVATRGDLPPNASEFLSRNQQSLGNLRDYTLKLKSRDLREYRETLASHRIAIVLKVGAIALFSLIATTILGSTNHAQTHPQSIQNGVSNSYSVGVDH